MCKNIVIVGTGAGGATAARDLSLTKNNVVMLEKGNHYQPGDAVNHIINKKVISNSPLSKKESSSLETTSPIILSNSTDIENQEIEQINLEENVHRLNIELMYLEGVGGTTFVSMANACYACSKCYADSTTTQFQVHDLELYNEFLEAGKEMNINPLPYDYRGPTTSKITQAAEELGYYIEAMPKFIDFSKCTKCGDCLANCQTGAKWDSSKFVEDAQKLGAELLTGFEVTKIIHDGVRVSGVEGIVNGVKKTIPSDKVILAAGALNTPLILRNSQITEGVGEDLFCDLFITVGAYLKDAGLNKEIPMGVKSEFGPYFLSPHYSSYLPPLIEEKFKKQGKEIEVTAEDVAGFMIKIADESNGYLDENGEVFKDITSDDIKLFNEGIKKATEILIKIGADPSSVVISPIRGAHPGGTASMGKVVDSSLQTNIKGLYIADASVIPRAPGRPPILTIVGLAKKLAKIINKENEGAINNSQKTKNVSKMI